MVSEKVHRSSVQPSTSWSLALLIGEIDLMTAVPTSRGRESAPLCCKHPPKRPRTSTQDVPVAAHSSIIRISPTPETVPLSTAEEWKTNCAGRSEKGMKDRATTRRNLKHTPSTGEPDSKHHISCVYVLYLFAMCRKDERIEPKSRSVAA